MQLIESGINVKVAIDDKSQEGLVDIALPVTSSGMRFIGFMKDGKALYGTLMIQNLDIYWDCDFQEGSPVRGKSILSSDQDLHFEGPFSDFKPHGKGVVKKKSDNKIVFEGVWVNGTALR